MEQDAQREQRAHAQFGCQRRFGRPEQRRDLLSGLEQMASGLPERQQRGGEPQSPLAVTALGQKAQRRTDVRKLRIALREPAYLTIGVRRSGAFFGEHETIGGVRLLRGALLAGKLEPLERVFANGFEHGEPRLGGILCPAFNSLDETLVHE